MKRIIFVLIFILIPAAANADKILLKNGEVIEGKVTQVRGIFIRVESDYKRPFREFLIENVANIEVTGSDEVSQLAIRNIHNRAISKEKERRLEATATALIEEAMQQTEGLSYNEAPENIKLAAEEKAGVLIGEAVKTVDVPNLESTSEEVKGIAKQKASGLIEQAVRTVETEPFVKAPEHVQRAAKKAASALIGEAVGDVEMQNQLRARSAGSKAIAVQKVGSAGPVGEVNPAVFEPARYSRNTKETIIDEVFSPEGGISQRNQVLIGAVVLLLGLLLWQKVRYRQSVVAEKEAEEALKPDFEPLRVTRPVPSAAVSRAARPPGATAPAFGARQKSPANEKRKYPRAECNFPISLFLDKLKSIPVTVKNVSLNGAYAVCNDINQLRRLGDQCQFRFNFASQDPAVKINGKAVVIRIRSDHGLGLKFFDLDVNTLTRLKAFQAA